MDLDPKEAENGDIGIMTLSDFKTWSSISLKTFLSLRKKQTNGSFDVLAARAFAAYEDGVPVDPKQEHIQRQLLKEYKEKLIIEGISIPDPIDLSTGWLGEEKGMSKWPRLYITDITRFYSDVIGKKDLIQRIESEYKQGKAYRYFSNSFIGEIFYNDISDTSPFCLFRTKCMPSQRISMKQYSIWAVVRKDGTDKVGGEILHAYCTCTAGLLGSCNHVAGLLFRVEGAVITGVSNPTCTSVKAYWVVPSKKKVIEPDEVSKFLFTQDTYLKKSTQQPVDQRKQNKQAKMSFQVMSNSQKELLNKGDVVRRNLYDKIKDVIPNSCFVELIEGAKKKSKPKHDIPTLKEFAESFKDGCDEDLDINMLYDIFTDSLFITDEQVTQLYNETVDQANSAEWFKQRHGRLTASKFKTIVNAAKRLRIEKKDCPNYIVSSIMGYTKLNPTWQMKHGINTEIHAKAKYKQLFKKTHKHCQFSDPGMTVLASHPFISVTPDLEIRCECHGEGLVEIKCPATLINKKPDVNNYKHIEELNDELILKKNSEYYFQIQGQLAVTKRKYCDLFIFSFQGHLTIRIDYDDKFWQSMLINLDWFWRNFIAPELLTSKLEKKMNMSNNVDEHNIVSITNDVVHLKPPKNETVKNTTDNITNAIDFSILLADQELVIVIE